MKPATAEDVILSEVIADALDIARRRKRILHALRHALEKGDNQTALMYAKQLCGVGGDEDESHQSGAGQHS